MTFSEEYGPNQIIRQKDTQMNIPLREIFCFRSRAKLQHWLVYDLGIITSLSQKTEYPVTSRLLSIAEASC